MKSREKRKVVIRKVPAEYVRCLPHREDQEGRAGKFNHPFFMIFPLDRALPGPCA
jgi:hypothetical protein